jgi:hypothetical protein
MRFAAFGSLQGLETKIFLASFLKPLFPATRFITRSGR